MHFMLECGFYSPIRSKHKNIFDALRAQGLPSEASLLRAVFDHKHQMDLACCIQEMLGLRESVLTQLHETSEQREADRGDEEDIPYIYDTFDEDDTGFRVWDGHQEAGVWDGHHILHSNDEDKGDDCGEGSENEELMSELVEVEWPKLTGIQLPPGFAEVV